MATTRKTSNWWTVWGVLILLWALFPLAWMVSLSFKDPTTFRSEKPTFFPKEWTWKNYDTVFSDSLFTSALRNSAGIALIATGLSVIFAMFAAYAIARLDFPGKRVILTVALAIAQSPLTCDRSVLKPLMNTKAISTTVRNSSTLTAEPAPRFTSVTFCR